jgi:hypothetical protein
MRGILCRGFLKLSSSVGACGYLPELGHS